jgi:hypothetical protein
MLQNKKQSVNMKFKLCRISVFTVYLELNIFGRRWRQYSIFNPVLVTEDDPTGLKHIGLTYRVIHDLWTSLQDVIS